MSAGSVERIWRVDREAVVAFQQRRRPGAATAARDQQEQPSAQHDLCRNFAHRGRILPGPAASASNVMCRNQKRERTDLQPNRDGRHG